MRPELFIELANVMDMNKHNKKLMLVEVYRILKREGISLIKLFTEDIENANEDKLLLMVLLNEVYTEILETATKLQKVLKETEKEEVEIKEIK